MATDETVEEEGCFIACNNKKERMPRRIKEKGRS
jgi:hypothetical protein